MPNDMWQLQEAKSKFSEVVERAMSVGPQTVTRRGVEAVVIVSSADYKRELKSSKSLKSLFRKPPYFDDDVVVERKKDVSRSVEL